MTHAFATPGPRLVALGILVLVGVVGREAAAECLKPIRQPPTGYQHDAYDVQPKDQMRYFRAYTVSFDGEDDGIALRVPDWVAYEMRKSPTPVSGPRPSPWCHDEDLFKQGLAASDASYLYSAAWRKSHKDWYARGHLAAKYHAERISKDAAWNTHTTLNAVPQRQTYNAGSWLSLECLTGAYANRYGAVWIITGPIFDDGRPSSWIGEESKGEKLVAVPDRLFKIVIRRDGGQKALAFVSANRTEKSKSPYDYTEILTSVEIVESLSGLRVSKLDATAKSSRGPMWPVGKKDFDAGCRIQAQTID